MRRAARRPAPGRAAAGDERHRRERGRGRRRGVALIAYEGGQHLVGIQGQENNDALNTLFDAVNQDPAMKALYLDYLQAWKDNGGGLFAHFVDTGRWSKWGRWGSRRYLDEARADMPKYDALMTFIEQTPRWW